MTWLASRYAEPNIAAEYKAREAMKRTSEGMRADL